MSRSSMSRSIAERIARAVTLDDGRPPAAGDDPPASAVEPTERAAPSSIHSRITRNGLHMAFVAAFAILGGSIRGFNLLVVLAGLMVGILLVQWRFSRAMLPSLAVRRMLPEEAYAGRPFKVRFTITNGRSWLSAWMIRLEDRIRSGRGKVRDNRPVCTLGVVHARTRQSIAYECTILRRGRYHFGPVRVASGFPLGLTQAWRNTRDRATLLVYPALAPLAPKWSELALSGREGLSASRQRSGQSEGEFFGIRAWQSGDSRRWVHWRTTARVQSLAVRQFEQPSRTELSLILDPYLTSGHDDADVEWAISITASIVLALSLGGLDRLALGVADAEARTLCSHGVIDFRRAAMGLLANVRPLAEPPLAKTLERVLRDGNPNWPVLIISPRPQQLELLSSGGEAGRGGSSGAGSGGLGAPLVSRLDIIWIDVTSPAATRFAFRESTHATP